MQDNANGVVGALRFVEQQRNQTLPQFSKVEELQGLFFQPIMKMFLAERKRNAIATKKWDQSASMNRLLSLLDLSVSADGNEVVPLSKQLRSRTHLPNQTPMVPVINVRRKDDIDQKMAAAPQSHVWTTPPASRVFLDPNLFMRLSSCTKHSFHRRTKEVS